MDLKVVSGLHRISGQISTGPGWLSHTASNIGVMSSKTHPRLALTENEMLERIRQAKAEDQNGTLAHITNEEELRSFFASLHSPGV